MSSSKKQIVIDHGNLLGGSANNTTLKRQRKVKPPAALIRPSTLKQNLLKKIKEHQQRHEETPQQGGTPNADDKDLANQFKMSTSYLEQLMARKQNKKPTHKSSSKSKTQQPGSMMQQQPAIMQQQPAMMQEVSLVLPPELQPMPTMTAPTTTIPTTTAPTTTVPTTTVPTTTVPTMTVPTPTMTESIAPIISPNFSQNTSDQIQIQPPLAEPFQQPSQAFPKFEFKDVPYGCLRGGNKPTYRTYHRNQNVQLQNNHNTTLKKPLFGHTVSTEPQNVDPIIQERQRKLREIQENNHIMRQEQNAASASSTTLVSNETNETAQHAGAIQPTKIKKEIKQTITKKYKLGKTPNGKVVGVLIKNSDTRRRIQEEHGILRRESIVEIRKYLHDHGLIKVGSDAPPDVLRNIYESAKMTGEVNNTNKHVMLHNFMKSDENTVNA